MIGWLSGTLLSATENTLVVVTHGVGYQVRVPAREPYASFFESEKIELFIYTHVKEEELSLYGFSSPLEKSLFLDLLTVKGVGPKGSLAILSSQPAPDLIGSIIANNADAFPKVAGVGKKILERVLLELAEKCEKKYRARLGAERPLVAGAVSVRNSNLPTVLSQALLSLGFKPFQLETYFRSEPGMTIAQSLNKNEISVDAAIRNVLKELR